jgi:hypothetical protein
LADLLTPLNTANTNITAVHTDIADPSTGLTAKVTGIYSEDGTLLTSIKTINGENGVIS